MPYQLCEHGRLHGSRCIQCPDAIAYAGPWGPEPPPPPAPPARQSIPFVPGAMEPRVLDGLDAVIRAQGKQIEALADLISCFAGTVEEAERVRSDAGLIDLELVAKQVKEEALRIAAEARRIGVPRGPGPEERG